jgi:branched-chain amino acid transport system ATP-binding protein
MLDLVDVSSGYGAARVLDGVSLAVGPGEVVALLGRNGAGKTTLLKTIMGLLPATRGRIRLGQADLVGRPAHEIPRLGVGYVPQGRRLFGELTVAENLAVGRFARRGSEALTERILALFPVLVERLDQRAGDLSGGEQQMLALARALGVDPVALLVDEPTEGLSPRMVTTIIAAIGSLRASGVAVLMVEQRIDAALAIADRVAVLENGRLVAEAPAGEVRRDPTLLRRHVGLG